MAPEYRTVRGLERLELASATGCAVVCTMFFNCMTLITDEIIEDFRDTFSHRILMAFLLIYCICFTGNLFMVNAITEQCGIKKKK